MVPWETAGLPLLTLWRRNLERSDGQQGPAVCSSTVGRFYQEEVVGIFRSSSAAADADAASLAT